MKQSTILVTKESIDYELLDSGLGEKLERFGKVVLSRPDPQALWAKKLDESEWKKAGGYFTRDDGKGEWTLKKETPDHWPIEFGGLKLIVKPTPFKHVGLFPEQETNWKWLSDVICNKENIDVLNLFAYTGGATLACAKAGAKVVHIDSSKAAIGWAKENAELSGLDAKPIRWILDDARAFVTREIKRERKYNGIIMDPPAFGHGPDNEIWKIEENLLALVKDCLNLFNDKPLFFLINGYAAGYSALAYENILLPLVHKYGGLIETGELAIKESSGNGKQELQSRLLPCGIFAKWSL